MAKDGEAYFTGDRGFWDDPDFETMQQQAVYAMLWQSHGTDIAGIRQRNDKLDAVRVNLTLSEFQNTLSILYAKGKITLYPDRIWIRSSIWRNLGKGKYSDKQMAAVITRLKSCGPSYIVKDVIDYYEKKYKWTIASPYPIDTLCNGYPSVSVSETVSVSVSETELTTVGKPKSVCSESQKDQSRNTGADAPKQLDPYEELRRDDLTKIVDLIKTWPCMQHAKNLYAIAGKLVKIYKGDPVFALEVLRQKSDIFRLCRDSKHLIASATATYRKAYDIPEIESQAHKEQAVSTGDPVRIGDSLKLFVKKGGSL